MFNPHQKFAPDRWFWQYGVCEKEGGPLQWSETACFVMPETEESPDFGLYDFVTPEAETVFRAIPAARLKENADEGPLGSDSFEPIDPAAIQNGKELRRDRRLISAELDPEKARF